MDPASRLVRLHQRKRSIEEYVADFCERQKSTHIMPVKPKPVHFMPAKSQSVHVMPAKQAPAHIMPTKPKSVHIMSI